MPLKIYLVSRVSGRVHLDPGGLYKAPIYFQMEIKIPKDIPTRAGICETNGRNIPNVKRPNVGPPMTLNNFKANVTPEVILRK